MRLAAQGLYWYIHILLNNGYKETEVDEEFSSLSKLVSQTWIRDQEDITPNSCSNRSAYMAKALK